VGASKDECTGEVRTVAGAAAGDGGPRDEGVVRRTAGVSGTSRPTAPRA
jgi:hypothetical protein